MSERFRQILVAAVAIIFIGPAARAGSEVTFERDVRPVLKAHCFQCHGERDKPKGKLDLRLRRTVSPAAAPGRPSSRASQIKAYCCDASPFRRCLRQM
jgi:hypothetical protein